MHDRPCERAWSPHRVLNRCTHMPGQEVRVPVGMDAEDDDLTIAAEELK